jgi:stage II sporulation protein B
MNKARITVKVTQRQPTSSPPDHHQHAPDQDLLIPNQGQSLFIQKQTSPLMQDHMNIPQVESPYLDEWSSWIAHEPMDIQSHIDSPKRTKMMWFQLGMSIGGAMITGLLIGLFMMKLFHYETDDRMVGAWPTEVPAQSYTFIQNGVFQSTDSAQKAQLALEHKGFSSYLATGDKHTIFVGFAITHEDAKSIASILKENHVDVFLKKIDIPAHSVINSQWSSAESLAQLMDQSNRLIRHLHDVTITQLTAQVQQPVSTHTIQTIIQEQKGLHEISTQFKDVNSHMSRSEVDSLLKALQQAVASLQAYQQQATNSWLWSIQSNMMQAILIQKQLLERTS